MYKRQVITQKIKNHMKKKIIYLLMKIKKMYKYKQLKKYYKKKCVFFEENKIDNSKDTVILTIAFNNVYVIKEQIELIEKFCKNNYIHIIADNSTDIKKRNEIKNICQKKINIYYYSLPEKNPYNNYDSSSSHGASINYLWINILSKLDNIKYILLLDHDIFPTKEFDLKNMLYNTPFYGVVKERKMGWYLWPGFSCFKKNFCDRKKLDFLPSKYGDTGSANYEILYKNFDLKTIKKASDVYVDLALQNVEKDDLYVDQKNKIEIIDDTWVHLINAADWAGTGSVEQKFKKMRDFMNNSLN